MVVRGPKYASSALVRLIKRWMTPWYVLTVALYAALIPMSIAVFPNTTLVTTVFVLFSGFTASVASLASALITADQEKALASVEDTVSEDKVVPSDEP